MYSQYWAVFTILLHTVTFLPHMHYNADRCNIMQVLLGKPYTISDCKAGRQSPDCTVSPYNMINATTSKLSVVGSQAGEKNINTALYLNAGATTTVTQGDSDVTFYIMYKVVTL